MSDRLTSDQAPFLIELGPYDEDVIQVVRFDSSERISAPFEVRVELASRDFNLDLESTVGSVAMMTVRGEYEERFIHGVVAEIESGVATANHCFYHAVIRPKFWLASQRSNCQIFQDLNVVDIAREVLSHHGMSDGVDYEFNLDNEPPSREYCVQYRESDLDFISRLMEEEGIFYWIEHGAERAKVVFGDSRGATPNIHGDYDVRMAAPSGLVAEQYDEQVFEFRSTKRVRPGVFTSTDYSFKEPSNNLATTADAGVDLALEVFDFPGEYTDSGVGTKLAKVRMEEQQVARREVSGRSNCTRFHPGMTFDLIEHPRDVLNASYLLTELRQLGASPQVLEEGLSSSEEARYSNEFVGIPADQRFRPARVTPRPIVRGTQVAKVVGPVGDEIHCDQYGRVRVQFFWDRYAAGDQTSSCWIRVSQAWADGGWGAMAIPRIGQEVLVDFLEGDPDQPVIVGRLYNGEKMPPNELPAQQSKMTIRSQSLGGSGGSNEITFDDTGGSEMFYEHAEHDMQQAVEHDRLRTVGNDETVSVGNSRTITVGSVHSESIGSDMSVHVGSNLTETVAINYSETVGATMELTVGGTLTEAIGVSMTQSVGSNKSESVGASKVSSIGKDLKVEVGSDHKLVVAGDSDEEVCGDSQIAVAKNLKVSAKKIQMVAEDEFVIKVGKAQLVMKKNGNIVLKGKKIDIKASGNLTMKGSKIAQN